MLYIIQPRKAKRNTLKDKKQVIYLNCFSWGEKFPLSKDIVSGDSPVLLTYSKDNIKLARFGKCEFCPIVPNMTEYIRELNNYGVVGIGIRRLVKLGPLGLVKVSFFILQNFFSLVKKDMKAIIPLLITIEMEEFRKLNLKIVFLHPHITDLFVSNGNENIFLKFSTFLGKYGVPLGLMTNNIGVLLKDLREKKISILSVCGPVNKGGYMMFPTQKLCESEIKKTTQEIIGVLLDHNLEGNREYINKLGISSIAINPKNRNVK
jgi:hypothetical protein